MKKAVIQIMGDDLEDLYSYLRKNNGITYKTVNITKKAFRKLARYGLLGGVYVHRKTNIYEKPDSSSNILGTLKKGEAYNVIQQKNGFLFLLSGSGWVKNDENVIFDKEMFYDI